MEDGNGGRRLNKLLEINYCLEILSCINFLTNLRLKQDFTTQSNVKQFCEIITGHGLKC